MKGEYETLERNHMFSGLLFCFSFSTSCHTCMPTPHHKERGEAWDSDLTASMPWALDKMLGFLSLSFPSCK